MEYYYKKAKYIEGGCPNSYKRLFKLIYPIQNKKFTLAMHNRFDVSYYMYYGSGNMSFSFATTNSVLAIIECENLFMKEYCFDGIDILVEFSNILTYGAGLSVHFTSARSVIFNNHHLEKMNTVGIPTEEEIRYYIK